MMWAASACLVGISERLLNNFEGVVGTLGNHHVNSVICLPRLDSLGYGTSKLAILSIGCIVFVGVANKNYIILAGLYLYVVKPCDTVRLCL